MNQADIWELILAERKRQDEKWGRIDDYLIMNTHEEWMDKLKEEDLEVELAMLDNRELEIQTELIHCAAVIVSWLEDRF